MLIGFLSHGFCRSHASQLSFSFLLQTRRHRAGLLGRIYSRRIFEYQNGLPREEKRAANATAEVANIRLHYYIILNPIQFSDSAIARINSLFLFIVLSTLLVNPTAGLAYAQRANSIG